MSLFLAIGGSGERISLPASISVSDTTVSPANASAQLELQNDGDVVGVGDSGAGDLGDWIAPKLNFGNYEAQLATVSGSVTSGTLDSYLNLGTTRNWTLNRTSNGTSTFTGTLTIRKSGTSTVLASCPVTLEATKEP